MIPKILHLGPFPINSFGLMVALAIIAGIYRLAISFKRNNLNPELAEHFVLMGGLSGLIGARIWFVLNNLDMVSLDPIGTIFGGAGFIFYGGFIVASIVLLILCRINDIKISSFMDSVGPTLCLGYAIGRIGCQLSGDGDYGIPTTSFLGMSYENGVVPTPPGVMAYPVPLYESIIALVIMIFLLKIEKSKSWAVPYRRFGLYLMLISCERFFIEFIRRNPEVSLGLSQAQIISTILCILGIFLIQKQRTQAV